jgi:hypothetical protein
MTTQAFGARRATMPGHASVHGWSENNLDKLYILFVRHHNPHTRILHLVNLDTSTSASRLSITESLG